MSVYGKDKPITNSEWFDLPDWLRHGLTDVGAGTAAVFVVYFDGEEEEELPDMLRELGGSDPSPEQLARLSRKVLLAVEATRPAAGRTHERIAATPLSAMAAQVGRSDADRKRLKIAEQLMRVAPVGTGTVPLAPRGEPARWPTKLCRSLALAGDPAGRRKAEEDERSIWTSAISELVREASLPLARAAADTSNPTSTLSRCAQGRRASTLRRKARDAWEARMDL